MRRILVVPDSFASALQALRDRPSFEVRVVAQAGDVIGLTARWPPELLIIGPELGDDDALRLARQLRNDRRLSELRILLVSDAVPRGPAGPVIHAEVDAHVVGPTSAELLRTIGTLLDVATPRPPRLAHEILARVSPPLGADPAADPDAMMAHVIGLSETTCYLECEQSLNIGAIVKIEMALPGGDPVISQAIVLAADELQLRYACELLDIDPDRRARIRMFLSQPGVG
jgi:DNA-binding response OmpR family regulator